MPNTISATDLGNGLVQLQGDLATAPTNHETITNANLPTSTTRSSGWSTFVHNSGLGVVIGTFLPTTSVRTGTVTRDPSGSPANARLAVDVRISGGSDPSKVRGIGGVTPGSWLDLTNEWQTVSYPAGTITASYGLEVAPLSPYSVGVSIEIRGWRLRDAANTLRPVITRSTPGYDDVRIEFPPSDSGGLEFSLDAQTFGLYDNSAPLNVASTYALSVNDGTTTAASVAQTTSATGPVVSCLDRIETGRTVQTVLEYAASVVPQQTLHDLVGEDAPLLVSSAGSTRSGSLALLLPNWDEGLEVLNLLGRGGRMLLRQSDLGGLDMVFAVTSANLTPAPGAQDARLPRWAVRVDYREVS